MDVSELKAVQEKDGAARPMNLCVEHMREKEHLNVQLSLS